MNNKLLKIRLFRLALVVMFSFFTLHFSLLTVNAHNFHTTLSRIDYNEKEKNAEIMIQMFTHDLSPTLEKINKKNIDYEKTKNIDKLIFDFVQKNFIIKDKNGDVKKLDWVGFEFEVDTIYVYVEANLPDGLEKASLQNSLFFDYFPEQSNLVVCKFADKKADLAFKVGDKFLEIKANQPKP